MAGLQRQGGDAGCDNAYLREYWFSPGVSGGSLKEEKPNGIWIQSNTEVVG